MRCGIIDARHSEDVVAYPCDRDAVADCIDCDMPVCDGHARRCALCNEAFCDTCLAFHSIVLHRKKPVAAGNRGKQRRSA